MKPSISENNGLAVVTERDQRIYSVGISTGGVAEIRMALASPTREITATTIDPEGAKLTQKGVEEAKLLDQIQVKIEDVAGPLPYPDEHFDFIYARLVLHYLPKAKLLQALHSLYRILKMGGRIFVVVRSVDCVEARDKNSTFDPHTGMTTYISEGHSYSRFFHSADSIQSYLMAAGFHIKYVKTYQEQLYIDYQRTQLSKQADSLIEVLADKERRRA